METLVRFYGSISSHHFSDLLKTFQSEISLFYFPIKISWVCLTLNQKIFYWNLKYSYLRPRENSLVYQNFCSSNIALQFFFFCYPSQYFYLTIILTLFLHNLFRLIRLNHRIMFRVNTIICTRNLIILKVFFFC